MDISFIEESLKAVDSIKFSIFSPNEMRKYSVIEVTAPETYDEDGLPVQGGLMDNRLGTLEPGQKCGTCGNTSARCPGHYGHVELSEPVIHIAFVDDVNVLLKASCRVCGRILLNDESIDSYNSKLSSKTIYSPKLSQNVTKDIIKDVKTITVCPHCNQDQFEIEFTKPTVFHELTDWGGATRLLPITIRERLERITDEDFKLLGYDPSSTRPEWFILNLSLIHI